MKLNARHIALAGILLAISAVLANTPLGMIPVPTPARYATIMHIPVIIVGILEGPLLGAITGILFGIMAFLKVPEFGPLVHILPRALVGVVPALVYMGFIRLTKGSDNTALETIAISLAAALGSLVNTAGVLWLAVKLMPNLMPPQMAAVIGLTSGIPEAILSVMISIPIVLALRKRFPMKYGLEVRTENRMTDNG